MRWCSPRAPDVVPLVLKTRATGASDETSRTCVKTSVATAGTSPAEATRDASKPRRRQKAASGSFVRAW
jgi:hypothetical protein